MYKYIYIIIMGYQWDINGYDWILMGLLMGLLMGYIYIYNCNDPDRKSYVQSYSLLLQVF